MSNHEQYPSSNDNNSVREQIPHSGIHHDETPVRDFDKTPLTHAVEQGLIETPDSPAILIAPEPPRERRDKRLGWKGPAAAVALLGAVGAGAFMAKGVGGDHSNAAPERSPSTSAPSNPGSSESPAPEQLKAPMPEFGFSAAEYASNPKQLIVDFNGQMNAWVNSGFIDKMYKDPRRFKTTNEDFAAQLAAESDKEFASKVFVNNWESNADLSEFYKNQTYVHMIDIDLATKTTPEFDSRNLESYKRYTDIVPGTLKAETQADGTIVGSYDYQGRDNSNSNLAQGVMGAGSINPNDETGTMQFTFVKEGDAYRLSDAVVNTN